MKLSKNRILCASFTTIACLMALSSVCLAQSHDKKGVVVKTGSYKPASTSAESEKGKSLYDKNNCSTCHTIGGTGGCLAPPLDGVGSRRSQKFIKLRIAAGAEDEFAEAYNQSELMPHLRISADAAQAISQYLLTLKEPRHGFKIIGHDDTKSGASEAPGSAEVSKNRSVARGRTLLSEKGCLACHSVGNLGGSFAPKFNGIASRLSETAIRRQMSEAQLLTLEDDPEYGPRGTVMPPLDLTNQDIDDITSYLVTLK
jgi:cytochrome c peroxidase